MKKTGTNTYQSPTDKLAIKLGLTVDTIRDIIVRDHELDHLINKKSLVIMKINLDSDSLKFVNRVSKSLKVSTDAVVVSALIRAEKANKELV